MYMNRKKLLTMTLLTIITPIQMLCAQNEVPTDFSSIATDDKNAFEFAKECIPTISEQSIKEPGKDKISVVTGADKTKPYIVITKGKIYCVPMSQNKNPILPLKAFENTIEFPEMEKDDVVKLRTDLSQQLATTGAAYALVINDIGNAYAIAYLFPNDVPYKVFYHAGFLKKGEFDEKKFTSVYKANGAMSITARGQPVEYSKVFF